MFPFCLLRHEQQRGASETQRKSGHRKRGNCEIVESRGSDTPAGQQYSGAVHVVGDIQQCHGTVQQPLRYSSYSGRIIRWRSKRETIILIKHNNTN